jgi:serine/threonine-protein kinase
MQVASPLNVGDIVAEKYAVEKLIGAGGMAIVALAAHVEYRQRVAIKILRPENSRKTEVVKRFEREQRTLTMLHSEHTLRIYGMGMHTGLPYMMIEYLQGKDLAEVIKGEGPLPIDRAVEYVLQACHALAEAHLLGVVHRDLKPGNLFSRGAPTARHASRCSTSASPRSAITIRRGSTSRRS